MVISVVADAAFVPPRNTVTVSVPSGQLMSSVSVWRNDSSGRTDLRTQPVAGFESRIVYDYECPFGVDVTYGWSASFFDQASTSTVWAEVWASLASWTAVGGSWSVSAGTLVWSAGDSLAASLTRSVTSGQYEVTFAAPPVGLSSINFGGFYLDVSGSRMVLGSASMAFDAGSGSWVVGVSDASVSLTTTAGTYTVSGSALVTQVAFVGAVSKVVWASKWGVTGTGNGEFNFPVGVVVDSAGYSYVLDRSLSRIQKFDSSGVYVTQWGSTGTGNGQFDLPNALAIDSSNNIYVVDAGNFRVQKFAPPGSPTNPHTYSTKWGSIGTGDGQFAIMYGIATDTSGNVYVTDENFGNVPRVQKFSSTGTFILKWGSRGTTNGAFISPYGIAIDSSNNVYVSDITNSRVQKFSATGTYVLKWGSAGSGIGQFNEPSAIATDAYGNVYVCDRNNYRVQVFENTGSYLKTFGSSGSSDGQFNVPQGLTVKSSQTILVADGGNDRIQTFTQTSALVDDVTLKDYGTVRSTVEEESATVELDPTDGWLIHPATPSLSFPIAAGGDTARIGSFGEIENESRATAHQILGADYPITTTNGSRGADNTSITIAVQTSAEEQSIKALLRDETPILINFPPSLGTDFDYGFYQVGKTTRTRVLQMPNLQLRDYQLPLQRVQSPIVTQQNVGWSWATLAAEFPTWSSLLATFDTWADVASNTRRTGS